MSGISSEAATPARGLTLRSPWLRAEEGMGIPLRRPRLISAWLLPILLLTTAIAAEAASGLAFVERQQRGFGAVEGLGGARGVAVSPDGGHVYVAGSTDDSLVVFRRDSSTGALIFVEREQDEVAGVDGLDGVRAVTVSPDGAHVYAAANRDDAVAVFQRDPTTGRLAFVERQRDALGGVDGLDGARAVAVSPDGDHVYVAGGNDDALAVFQRDKTTGALTFHQVVRNDAPDISGLNGANSVVVSPDGAHVYAAGKSANSVVVFSRDPGSGALTFRERQQDDTNGVDGLEAAVSVAISPDGKHLYAAGELDDAVAVFQRDALTGALSFREIQRDGVNGVGGLDGVQAVAVSPDGAHVYATSFRDGTPEESAVVVFDRDAGTGALTFAGAHRNGVGNVAGLAGAAALAISPGGEHVYVAASDDDAIAVFSTRCGDGVVDPGEQCDDGNTAGGDGCSAGCRSECVAPEGCDDGDGCTEERCRGGECANPRCGFPGATCQLVDTGVALTEAAECDPMPRGLERAIRLRARRAQHAVARVARRRNPDLRLFTKRLDMRLLAIEIKAARLGRSGAISPGCLDMVTQGVEALADALKEMLLHTGLCVP
jgi:cysteine-rich repeat protein